MTCRCSFTVDDILDRVCARFKVSREALFSETRTMTLVAARKRAAKMMRRGLAMTYVQIGEVMGRDHTSIMHLVKQGRGQFKAAQISARRRLESWNTQSWDERKQGSHDRALLAALQERGLLWV